MARAALREPDLPTARLDGPERELRLLVDHREDLVAERARVMARLRWHLHELDPSWEPAPRSLDRARTWTTIEARLDGVEGMVARLARDLVGRCRQLTVEINELHREITALVTPLAPTLLAICGCGALTAAKIIAETAGVDRFRSRRLRPPQRHRPAAGVVLQPAPPPALRTGNRQLNAALYRIALTQARCHPGARTLLERRRAQGDSTREAFRVLRRRLSDVVYRALLTDQHHALPIAA